MKEKECTGTGVGIFGGGHTVRAVPDTVVERCRLMCVCGVWCQFTV